MYVDVFRWIVVIALIVVALATIISAVLLSRLLETFRRPVGGPPNTGTVNPQL